MGFVNRVKLAANYLGKKTDVSNRPVEVSIELTNHCNLACIMCNRQEMTRPLGNINWKTFRTIVDQTYQTAELYYFHCLGETLLHPQLPKMIDYCGQKKVPVSIATNATLLDKQKTKMLLKHPPDHIFFAMDATNAETYKKIRGKDCFHIVRRNILYYLKEKRKNPVKTKAVVLFVKQKLNRKQAGKFKEYWQNKGVSGVYIKSIMQFIKLKPQGKPTRRCPFPWQRISFTWEGEAFPCCIDTNCRFNLGNINSKSFPQIWNCPNYQKLRGNINSGKLNPLCRCCTMFKPSPLEVFAMSFIHEFSIIKALPSLEGVRRFL